MDGSYSFRACTARFAGAGSKSLEGEAGGGGKARLYSPFLQRAYPGLVHPQELSPADKKDSEGLEVDAHTALDHMVRQLIVYDPAKRPPAADLLREGGFCSGT